LAKWWHGRLHQKLKRGPFESSAEWLATLLNLVINENREKIQKLTSDKSHPEESILKVDSIPNLDPGDELEPNAGQVLPSFSYQSRSSDSGNEEVEDAKGIVDLAQNLIEAIPTFFPESSTNEVEETCLCHDDLNWHNILVDTEERGALTAIFGLGMCLYRSYVESFLVPRLPARTASRRGAAARRVLLA
jgi:hypothetical protein